MLFAYTRCITRSATDKVTGCHVLFSSGLPRFVREYAKCLKDVYLAKPKFPQPNWPQTKATEVTKLVIIGKTSREGFSKKRLSTVDHCYVYESDNITAYKKEIELVDILAPVPSENDEPPKPPKVLLDGAPGVGKTTLTIKACTDWAKGLLFHEYELVILVSLRAKYQSQELKHLFPEFCDQSKVIDYCVRNSGKNVALIFDGYDELSYEERECNSIFLDIIHGDVLPKCAVLVTSRPYASGYLHQLESINCHAEIVGFKKEQVYSCIQQNIQDSSSADRLIKQLEEREDILSLCYIPLNCMIMMHVYELKGTLSTTMTELFTQFILDSVTRDIKYAQKSSKMRNTRIRELDCLPDPINKQLASLEKVAFESLVKDHFVFSRDELQSTFSGLGSLDDITSLCLGLITSVSTSDINEHFFQFLHLSVHEFLAARYAVNSKELKQIDMIQMFVNRPRFRLFLLFYVGLMPLKEDTAKIIFYSELKSKSCEQSRTWSCFSHMPDPISKKFLYFTHMIFESQKFESFTHLFNGLNDKKVLSFKQQKLTQFEITVLAYFLCSVKHSWQELNLQNCSLSMQSLQIFD